MNLSIKKLFISFFSISISTSASLWAQVGPSPVENAPSHEQIDMKALSQTYGHFIGKSLDIPGVTFDLEALIQGIHDAKEGKASLLSEEVFEAQMTFLHEDAMAKTALKNLQDAENTLKSLEDSQEMVSLEEGKILYQVLEAGSGEESVHIQSCPKVHFKGSFMDGQLFGNSADYGEPIRLVLEETIPGIQKGLLGAKKGEVRKIYVHPEKGYGASSHMPPNSLLIFEISVVETHSEMETDS